MPLLSIVFLKWGEVMKEILSNLKGFFAAFHAEKSDYSGLRAEAHLRDCDLLRVYDGGELSYLVLLKDVGVTARLKTLDDVSDAFSEPHNSKEFSDALTEIDDGLKVFLGNEYGFFCWLREEMRERNLILCLAPYDVDPQPTFYIADVNSGNVFDKCNFDELFDAAKNFLNDDDD